MSKNHLYNYLTFNKCKVKIIKFPNRSTKSGQIIDKFLKNEYCYANCTFLQFLN